MIIDLMAVQMYDIFSFSPMFLGNKNEPKMNQSTNLLKISK